MYEVMQNLKFQNSETTRKPIGNVIILYLLNCVKYFQIALKTNIFWIGQQVQRWLLRQISPWRGTSPFTQISTIGDIRQCSKTCICCMITDHYVDGRNCPMKSQNSLMFRLIIVYVSHAIVQLFQKKLKTLHCNWTRAKAVKMPDPSH